MKFITGDMSAQVPIYVTRKTAGGTTGQLSISVWVPVLAMFLVFSNILVWSVIGLYEAWRVIA